MIDVTETETTAETTGTEDGTIETDETTTVMTAEIPRTTTVTGVTH